MKHTKSSLIARAAIFLAMIAAVAGCQSKPQPASLTRGANAAQAIETAASTIQTGRAQINTTLAALRNLTERPADIPAQYAVVREQFAALRTTAAQISSLADEMRVKNDAYLAEWGRQVATISDPDLRQAGFDRRAETAARLKEIFSGFQTVKADYAVFQKHLADIQTALGADLSTAGLNAIKPFVTKATLAAEPLKASLDELTADFRAAGLALQPGKP
jgi:hypothetical protein